MSSPMTPGDRLGSTIPPEPTRPPKVGPGGNGSLIGASANLTVAAFAERAGQSFRFLTFMKLAFPIMIVTLGTAHVYLYMRYL